MSTTASALIATRQEILVVDDNHCDAQIALQILARLDPRPRTLWLRDGREAMNYLCRHEDCERGLPMLVLMDMHVPLLSGLELLAQMRSKPRLCLLPVIMLSGNASLRELRECYRLGIEAYVEKGINDIFSTELAKAVAQYFNSATIARES